LAGIDFSIPTLVYAECVLTYIHTDATNVLLENISKWFEKLTFLNYEMFNPNDSFGKMMVKNFEVIY
jgi:O-methyltransferase involved in polyketide biosynthesis